MKLVFPKGTTSRIITVFIQDSSSSTGAGLGSLTQSSNIVGGYVREGETGVALAVDEDVTTEGTYQAPSAAGKVRIGTPANMRTGTYELHFHNDLWATGAETVTITLGGATNMAPLNIEVQLSDPVRGLGAPTALPNAAADAAGGLPISDAGGLDLDAKLAATNEVTAARMGALTDWLDGGRLDLLIDAIKAKTDSLTFTVAGDVDCNIQSIGGSALSTSSAQIGVNLVNIGGSAITHTSGILAVNSTQISGSANAANQLEAGALTIVSGTVDNSAHSPTTTEFEADDITEATADHYIGRTIIFTSGALQYQQTTITDYALAGANGHFTVDALTEAPANNDTFIIV